MLKMEYPHYLKHAESLMSITGLFSLKTKTKSKSFLNWMAYILRGLLAIGYALFMITTLLGFINVESEADFKVNYLMHAAFYSFTCWKIAISQTETMKKLATDIVRISEEIISGDDMELKDIYAKSAKYNFRLFCYIFSTANLAWGLFLVTSTKDFTDWDLRAYYAQQNQTLPFRITAWYPFDPEKYFGYVYYFQCIFSTVSNLYNLSCESLLLSVINFATLRLSILKFNLRNLGEGSREKVRVLVQEHQDIIRYVDDLDLIMKWFFFGDVFGKSYHVSITLFFLFQVINQGGLLLLVIFALACSLFVVSQMFCEYYSINDITVEALGIDSAIFQSNWVDQENDVKITLSIMMIRSQKPLEMHVGNLDTVSITTLIKVLKAGFSYILLTL